MADLTGTDAPPASIVRRLIRAADRASLATLDRGDDARAPGAPYASLVLVACDHDGSPLLLISGLADHTRNIEHDDRVSLLFDGTAGLAEPLTGARVTIQGRAYASAEERHRARFLARHPSSAMYAGFRDFAFYRIAVERAHLVAGFGRIHWLPGDRVIQSVPQALAARETDIVGHMNEDHGAALDLYANRLLGEAGTGWRMTGIDAEGADLRREGRVVRLDFARPVADAEAARVELVRLVRQARESQV